MVKKSPYKNEGMFAGANHFLFSFAKDLRKNMTDSEIVLWQHLKMGVKGLKFRRQHPVGIYVADFYCHKIKLIIELDGSIHNLEEIKKHDAIREKDLEDWGFKIIRFSNEQVMKGVENVLNQIENVVVSLLSK